MSIDIEQGRARVVVEPTIYGTYETEVIRQLRTAVVRTCRAIGSPEALELAAAVEEDR